MFGRTEFHQEGKILVGTVPLVMGTKLTALISGTGENAARRAWNRSAELAAKLEAMLNRFSTTSEVSLLNAGCSDGPRTVSPELERLLSDCEGYRLRTAGLFDITKGSGTYSIGNHIADLQGSNVDFGGIAKGWFLKECRKIFAEEGILNAFVSFGSSSILGMGHHPHGDCWKVSVVDPFTGVAVTERGLLDRSLSVSGNRPGYEGHIVDPRTKGKIRGWRIAVAESADPAEAEALSTTALIASAKELETVCKNFKDTTIHTYND